MRTLALLFVLSLAGSVSADERGEIRKLDGYFVENIEREVDTKKGGKLVLDSDRGPIEVESWDKDVVQVLVEKRADVFTKEEASRLLADFELDLTVNDGGREIVLNGESSNSRRSNSLDVRFTIKVPMRYNVAVKTGGGGINIGDLQGNVDAETSGGGIEVGQIKAGSVDISTSGGGLTIKGVDGGNVRAETAGGSINIGDVTGDVEAETSGGVIHIGRVDGVLNAETAGGGIHVKKGGKTSVVETSGGSINIDAADGPIDADTAGGSISIGPTKGSVKLETSGGSIQVDKVDGEVHAETAGGSIQVRGASGDVVLHTSGGSIQVKGAQGAVEAETAGGGIEVEFIAGGGDRHCTLETAGGDINISLPSDMKATVDAELRIQKRGWSSKDYDIYSDFKLDIDKKEGDLISARGKINGGGNMVRLRTTNGDINIEKR
ncbi:MAG: DUF4097 and DUF4098 domain-containing protein YvlB [Candidatus Latescibacterota bacterium]|jgi:DUF4097 and DUF4098 domain-containing protein YvlB